MAGESPDLGFPVHTVKTRIQESTTNSSRPRKIKNNTPHIGITVNKQDISRDAPARRSTYSASRSQHAARQMLARIAAGLRAVMPAACDRDR
jgi:hypothetical protein